MENVNQIRQLLKGHCKWCLKVNGCMADLCNITVALTLLPCETCNGLRVVPHGNWTNKPCPDCQKKPPNINPAETIAEYPESQLTKKPLDFQEILDCWSVHPIDDKDCVSCPQMYECQKFRKDLK